MQALLEFAPLLAFIIAYYVGGLYTATAVLMVAMVPLLVVDYLLQSVSRYGGSSSDAIYLRCTSSACRLSSTCLRGSTMAWISVGN